MYVINHSFTEAYACQCACQCASYGYLSTTATNDNVMKGILHKINVARNYSTSTCNSYL